MVISASLIRRLREASTGRIEWRVMSPDRTGMVMWFSREGPDAVLDPEREAREWLRQHQADYPQRFAGYIVERAVALNQADQLMQEAAAELEKSDAQALRLVAAERERLGHIAAIAHGGGLGNMSESEALVLIRKLTLPNFDTRGDDGQLAARVLDAHRAAMQA